MANRRRNIGIGIAAAILLAVVVVTLLRPARAWLVAVFAGDYRPAPVSSAETAEREVALEVVLTGLEQPTDVQLVPGTTRRFLILEKAGRALVAKVGDPGEPTSAEAAHVLLQLKVRTESELGLLGAAFHPDFQKNGLFYLNYNPDGGSRRTVVAEWHVAPGELASARAEQRRVLLEVEQPYPNHNGGQLVFGPDRMLYIGMGDGGWRDDPHGNGQNPKTLLGAILRIDVAPSGDRAYGIPSDNPFADGSAGRPEVWVYGVRNPWRFSFSADGRMIVADVGQNKWEEVSIATSGANLGWNVREGKHCFEPPSGCRTRGLTEPFFEYGRDSGQSITGGREYRGAALPDLVGRYVVADFVQGRFWSVPLPGSKELDAEPHLLGKWSRLPSAFGADGEGELIVADFGAGELAQLVSRPRK